MSVAFSDAGMADFTWNSVRFDLEPSSCRIFVLDPLAAKLDAADLDPAIKCGWQNNSRFITAAVISTQLDP